MIAKDDRKNAGHFSAHFLVLGFDQIPDIFDQN